MLTARPLSPHEIRWLIAMDNAWISTIAQERSDRQDREKAKADQNKSGSR